MKVGTKAMVTILMITILTVSSATSVGAVSANTATTQQRKLERLHRRHDRKMELRASVLGITADELRDQLHQKSFDQILKDHGFSDRVAFYKALEGKLRDELKKRGLSDDKINQIIAKREQRMQKYLQSNS